MAFQNNIIAWQYKHKICLGEEVESGCQKNDEDFPIDFSIFESRIQYLIEMAFTHAHDKSVRLLQQPN